MLLVLFVNVIQLIICSNAPTNTRNCVLQSRHGYFLKIDGSGNVGTTMDKKSSDGETLLFFLIFYCFSRVVIPLVEAVLDPRWCALLNLRAQIVINIFCSSIGNLMSCYLEIWETHFFKSNAIAIQTFRNNLHYGHQVTRNWIKNFAWM